MILPLAFFAGVCLALQACALITVPVTEAILGGTQLAIKGEELRKEIKKADAQEAIGSSFENIWDVSFTALVDLGVEIIRIKKTGDEEGGIIEGRANKIKIKVAAVKLTGNITEIGIWTSHDKALARLIAEKIREGAQEPENCQGPTAD